MGKLIEIMGRGEVEIEFESSLSAEEVLDRSGFSIESAVLKVNGDLALEDDEIEEDDEILVVPAISGG